MPGRGRLRAIVIGAGVGGLATAVAFRRAGIDVAVFERRSDVSRVQRGGGFVLWQNAVTALAELDLADQTIATATPLERSEWLTWNGEVLASWPVADISRRHGVPALGVRRTAVHATLLDATDEGSLHLGAQCMGFAQDESGVTVEFADGTEERGDVLVGADGINSTIRAQQVGSEKLRFAGYAVWFGIVEGAHHDYPAGTFRALGAAGARFYTFPVGPDTLYWSGFANMPPGTDEGPVRKAELLERFHGWHPPTEALIHDTDEATIHFRDIVDRKPIKRWSDGRVTLLGDAAHPMTPNLGQGAAMAVEDAVTLAKCLSEVEDVPSALRAYEQRRVGRTRSFTNRSRWIGTMEQWTNPVTHWLGTRMKKIAFAGPALRQHEKDIAFEP